MNSKTAEIIASIKSPSMMDIIKFHGNGQMKYNSYDNNAHCSQHVGNEIDNDYNSQVYITNKDMENMCKVLYINWRDLQLQAYDKWQNLNPGKTNKSYELLKEYSPEKVIESNNSFAQILQNSRNLFPDIPYIAKDQQDVFFHIKVGNMYRALIYQNSITGNEELVEARLYLNLKTKNCIDFTKLFISKCKQKELFAHLKFSYSDDRNDSWLVYCSYENLPQYIEIIEEIKKEHPQLLDGTEKVSYNMGVLNGYIGYGEEPYVINNGKLKLHTEGSYNSRLKHATQKIYYDITDCSRNKFFPNFSFDTITKGNQNDLLVAGIKQRVKPQIAPQINQWLNTPEGKQYLQIKNTTREKILDDYTKRYVLQLYKHLLTGNRIYDEKLGSILIPFSQIDYYKICDEIFQTKKGCSKFFKQRIILQYLTLPEGYASDEFIYLTTTTMKCVCNALEEYIKEYPNNKDALALYQEFLQPTTNAKSQAAILSIQLLQNRTQHRNVVLEAPSGSKLNLTNHFNTFALFTQIIGEAEVENIARKYCTENNIDYDNVCYNGHTQKQIDKALNNEKNK